ncbi:MAG: murein biosynthesis integral membrane protein MurJ, partial [Erysipelothrix sp.]|nr:murein biosynthesis integral membrane protein MurJ [Erysipelothrix sp.]
TQDNVTMTSIALIGYAVGLVGMSIRLIASRAYYAFQDSKTVMTNSAITVGMNIILNLVLMPLLGIGGLALATSISVTISTVVLFYGLKKQLGQLGLKQYLTIAIKCGLASLAMGAVSYLVYTGLISILPMSNLYNAVALFVAVGAGAIVYAVLCYVLKVDEVRNVVSRIKVMLLRRKKHH